MRNVNILYDVNHITTCEINYISIFSSEILQHTLCPSENYHVHIYIGKIEKSNSYITM